MGIIGRIRKHSGLAVTIVGLAIVAFIIGDLSKNNNGNMEMGKIDGQVITSQHFDMLYREHEANMKQQYLQYYGTSQLPAGAENELRDQVWARLLQDCLVGSEMENLGIKVSSEELSDMYLGEFIHPQIRQAFTGQDGNYNVQMVKSILERTDLDSMTTMQLADLKKQVTENRALSKYSALLSKSFYFPRVVANKLAELGMENRSARMVRVPFTAVADNEVSLSQADYQAYYDEHKNEFKVDEEYRQLEYVLFRIVPSQADLQEIEQGVNKLWADMQATSDEEMGFFVSTENLQGYDSSYHKASDYAGMGLDSVIARSAAGSLIEPRVVGNQWVMGKVMATDMRPDSLRASAIYIMNNKIGNGITRSEEQAVSLADSVLRLIKAGMPFDTAVVRFSDSKENMGDLNWALDGGYGFLNEDIVKHNVGDVFSVARPDKAGQIIVKVTGKTPASKKYRVAMVARNIEASNATEKSIYSQASMFAGNNRSVAEMEAAVKEQNLMMNSAQVIAMSYTIDNYANVREIVRWAFNKDTKEGTVAEEVFSLDNNAYAVVALKSVVKKGFMPLDQLTSNPEFENRVRLEKQAQVLMEKAQQCKGDLNAFAAKFNATIDTIEQVNFNAPYLDRYGAEPRVMGAVVAAQKGAVVGPVKGYNGVYMAQVDNVVKSDNADELKAQAANICNQMEQQASQKLNKIVYMLKENVKVVDNRALHF